MHPTADAGVFALGVFADDHPVELPSLHFPQRAGDARQYARRTHVGVLVERLADRQPQSPQGDVIGHVGRAGRAEQDGIVMLDLVAAVGRHHAAMLLVVVRSPVEAVDLEREAAFPARQRLQHLDARGNDFGANPVAGDGCDPVGFHVFRLSRQNHSALTPAALITAPQRGTSATRWSFSAAGVASCCETGSVPRLAKRSITLASLSAVCKAFTSLSVT